MGNTGAESETIVGKGGNETSSDPNVAVDEIFGRAGCGARRDGQGTGIVHAEENSATAWQWQKKGRPAIVLARSCLHLALETAETPEVGDGKTKRVACKFN